LPTLEQVLKEAQTSWKKILVPNWYGEERQAVEIASATAVWYHPGTPPLPIRWVLIRDPKGKFKTQAWLCTDLTVKAEQISNHEVRDHLGVETQRQWSAWAIARTTPALLGLFSLVTLLANTHAQKGKIPIRQDAWYCKPLPTFSDALAFVRQKIWQQRYFQLSQKRYDVRKMQTHNIQLPE
jgi:hypothetical protein